uniref:uncharacterized protein LOC131107370 n=1 Tax=Doryrhamphus excisus TaxID=161450 RepID=UPI0025AD9DBF|nr:uncharacterized protein LOC131107370 [Doryrhamphus excisus]
MALPPSAKKLRNTTLTPKYRAEQYPGDFYVSGDMLFCTFCQHSVDWKRKNTCDDHLLSKSHLKKKETHSANASRQPRQTCVTASFKSADLRKDFVEDFVSMCAEADIPLEKLGKIRPFLVKHCKQGGALPENASSLRQLHLPRVFEQHISSVLQKIRGKKLSVVVDETTDARDCSVLNIVIGVENQYFLVDVVFMDRCNFSTVSQAIVASLHSNNLHLNDVWAVVTDNAAYCIKAYREVLQGLMPSSVHVTCLCHIINLVGETWQHFKYLSDVSSLVTWMRSVFFKKPARKRRWLNFLINKEVVQVKIPPEAVCTRWNSWFEAVKYHTKHVHQYRDFLLAEESTAMAVTNILSLVETEEKVQTLTLKLTFISEACSKLMTSLTILEGTHRPTAVSAYNVMEELGSYLVNGTAKTCGYGPEMDELLRQLKIREKREVLDNLHEAFHLAFTKFSKHWDQHPAREVYRLLRVFDPRQAPAMEKRIEAYTTLKPMANPSPELSEEWMAYQHCVSREPLPTDMELANYWRGMSTRFPRVAEVAVPYIYFPVSSVDCERTFSKYKTLLTDKRETLTEQNTKRLAIMYFNGDVSARWDT